MDSQSARRGRTVDRRGLLRTPAPSMRRSTLGLGLGRGSTQLGTGFEDATVVREYRADEIGFDHAPGEPEIDHPATHLQRTVSELAAFALTETRPAQKLVHSIFERLAFAQVRGAAKALNAILDLQRA